jgi:hypothetical protein
VIELETQSRQFLMPDAVTMSGRDNSVAFPGRGIVLQARQGYTTASVRLEASV